MIDHDGEIAWPYGFGDYHETLDGGFVEWKSIQEITFATVLLGLKDERRNIFCFKESGYNEVKWTMTLSNL